MRRILRILKWLGVGLSALLFAGTLVLWARGVGHDEQWRSDRFEPEPRWKTGPRAGAGTGRWCFAGPTRGWLRVGWGRRSGMSAFQSRSRHERRPMTADQAKQLFEFLFVPQQAPGPKGSFERAWNRVGLGFHHGRGALDPDTGQATFEVFNLGIPFWMLAVVFGSWSAAVLARRLLRRRRHAPGLCPRCGYDLRATPDASGPRLPGCPECGRETAEAVKIA